MRFLRVRLSDWLSWLSLVVCPRGHVPRCFERLDVIRQEEFGLIDHDEAKYILEGL